MNLIKYTKLQWLEYTSSILYNIFQKEKEKKIVGPNLLL